MNNAPEIANHPLLVWVIIFVSIALVAGITYVYTNRNIRITAIFSLISGFVIGLIKLIGVIQIRLDSQFIGAFDESRIPYIAAHPGWHQLLFAWHIWILPVILAVTIVSIIFYLIQRLHKHIPQQTISSTAANRTTRAERLSTFMAMDAAKQEARNMNEKLAEALLMNAAYEIKVSDLSLRVRQLEKELFETNQNLEDEMNTIKLELTAKNRENEYIAEQLAERSRELDRAHDMFEKLLALQQDKPME